MAEVVIIHTSGETVFTTPINEGSKRKYTLQQEDYITLKFSTATPVYFRLGDHCAIDDDPAGLFEVVSLQAPTYNTTTGGYDYELRLDAYYMKWRNKIFKFTPEVGGQEASWNLTATIGVHLGILLRNLSALGYKYNGLDFTFSIDDTVEDIAKLVSYDNTNLVDALSMIAQTWNCEWWVTNNVIRFGKCEQGNYVTFEEDVNVEKMSRSDSSSTFATRIYAFGSTRNIPTNYRPVDTAAVVNGIVQKRLMLPIGTSYIDAYPNMSNEEAVEQVVVFDDVYPKRLSTIQEEPITRELTDTVENEGGTTTVKKWNAYRFNYEHKDFKKEYIIPGETLKIVFQSGSLNGMEFEVTFNPDNKPETDPLSQIFEVVRNEDYGRPLPDDTLKPKKGDTYILFNFDINLVSDSYITEAENELKAKAEEYVNKSKIDPSTYSCPMWTDAVMDSETFIPFDIGQRVNLVNRAYFENGRNSRIIGFEYNLDMPYDHPIYTVGESTAYSRLNEIEGKVDAITYKGQTYTSGGNGVYIITSIDRTTATDSNVFSAKRTLKEFLSKVSDDTARGLITFLKGIGLGEGFSIGASGNALLNSLALPNASIDALGNALLNAISSPDFNSATETGFRLTKGADGGYGLFIKNLTVWGKVIFNELEKRKVTYVGGNFVFSPAGGTIAKVDEESGGYKCYLLADNGTTATTNLFDVDDQVLCQSFNIKEGVYEGVANKRYWRKITAMSTSEVEDTGKKYSWVMISKTDCEAGSDTPAAGDVIVVRGNRTKPDRQSFIEIDTQSETAPSIAMYKGVNSYSLAGKDKVSLSPSKVKMITDELYMTHGDNDPVRVPTDTGQWNGSAVYYDRVSFQGSLWLCVAPDGVTVTTPPSESSDYWQKQVAKGDQGIAGTNGANGQTSYLHIKYSDNGTSFTANSGETPGAYIGQYTDFVAADSTTFSAYTWTKIKGEQGVQGNTGADGRGILLITNYYLATSESSGVSIGSGNWTTDIQSTTTTNKYLWNYEEVKYTNNSTSTTSPRIIGTHGETGSKGATGAAGKGISAVTEYYAVSSSNSNAPSSWQTTVPTLTTANKYLWNYEKITYTDNSTTESTKCVIGVYGDTGTKGDTGATGATGTGVASITEEYYLSTSKTSQTGGSWVTTPPTWSSGKYIWTRSKIVYTNPASTVYTTPVVSSEWEAVNGLQEGIIPILTLTPETLFLTASDDGSTLYGATSKVTYTQGTTASGVPTSITINTKTNCNALLSGNGIYVAALTHTVSYTGADGTTKSVTVPYGDGYVDFTAVCNGITVSGRLPWQVKASVLYDGLVSNKEQFTQIRGRFDTVDGKLTQQQTAIELNARDITLRATKADVSTAKDNAISTASSDATNKANTAQANAKTYTEGQFKVANDNISLAVTKIQVGSRNLLQDTQKMARTDYWNLSFGSVYGTVGEFTARKTTVQWGRPAWIPSGRLTFEKGKTYTLSFWAKRDASKETKPTQLQYFIADATKMHYVSLLIDSVSQVVDRNSQYCIVPLSTNYQRFVMTVEALADYDGYDFRPEFYTEEYQTNTPCGVVYGFCLVEGNKDSGWSPSPEDVPNTLKRTGIDLDEGTIAMQADNFTLTNVGGEKTLFVNSDGDMELAGVVKAKALYRTYGELIADDNGQYLAEYGPYQSSPTETAWQMPPDIINAICNVKYAGTTKTFIVLPWAGYCVGRMIDIYGVGLSGNASQFTNVNVISFGEGLIWDGATTRGEENFVTIGSFRHYGVILHPFSTWQLGNSHVKLLATQDAFGYQWTVLDMNNAEIQTTSW